MEDKKKILHLSHTDIRHDGRILKELESLKKLQDVEIHAFGINDYSSITHALNQPNHLRTFNLHCNKIKRIPRAIAYTLFLIEMFIRLIVPMLRLKPQIIHCHDTLVLPIGLIGKIFSKSILIYDAHELESNKASQSKALSKATLLLEKISWKKIDLLVSVSPSITGWYEKKFGKKDNILILNTPYLDKEILQKEKSDYLRQKFNIPQDASIFIYLGIISAKGRGVEIYLDVFKRKKINEHIVFIGYGDYVEVIVENSKQYSNIHYHPPVSHEMIVEVARSADVGLCLIEPVSLSDYYALPNKLFEYAFSGLFVIASNLPEISNYVSKYSLGEVCELDANDLFHIVKNFNKDKITPPDETLLYEISWSYQEDQLLKKYTQFLNTLSNFN